MTPKIEILGQKFAHFGRFEGSFLTILGVIEVVLELFRKLLGTVSGIKRRTFTCSLSFKDP